MDQSSFFEYALRYLLVPGQRVGAHEALTCAGLIARLPTEVERLLHHCDELGHQHLVLTESDPLLMQWNPFSGVSPLYTSSPFGAALLANHRWMQGMHESMVKVVYEVVHESVHAVWAALGLRGLLTSLSFDEQARFHMFVEACAVLFGDLEAHDQLRSAQVFDEVWPAGAYRSHAVAFSPTRALEASGLDQAKRADWIFSVYLDQNRALPQRPESSGLRAEALAFLIEECSYAEKADLNTTPHWMRRYWSRVEIESYLRDFVPPAPLKIPQVAEPIDSVERCRRYWRELLLSGAELSSRARAYQRARLSAQRTGLRASEMIGVFDSYRLCAPESARREAIRLTRDARDQVLSSMRDHLWSSQGEINEASSQELISTHEASLLKLQEGLSQLFGGNAILEHPHLDDLPFKDVAPPLIERGSVESRGRAELSATLQLVVDEARATHQRLSQREDLSADSTRSTELMSRNRQVFSEAHRLIGALELDETDELCAEVEQFLMDVKRQRSLWLTFPLEWLSACPFVDPLIGFRYR